MTPPTNPFNMLFDPRWKQDPSGSLLPQQAAVPAPPPQMGADPLQTAIATLITNIASTHGNTHLGVGGQPVTPTGMTPTDTWNKMFYGSHPNGGAVNFQEPAQDMRGVVADAKSGQGSAAPVDVSGYQNQTDPRVGAQAGVMTQQIADALPYLLGGSMVGASGGVQRPQWLTPYVSDGGVAPNVASAHTPQAVPAATPAQVKSTRQSALAGDLAAPTDRGKVAAAQNGNTVDWAQLFKPRKK